MVLPLSKVIIYSFQLNNCKHFVWSCAQNACCGLAEYFKPEGEFCGFCKIVANYGFRSAFRRPESPLSKSLYFSSALSPSGWIYSMSYRHILAVFSFALKNLFRKPLSHSAFPLCLVAYTIMSLPHSSSQWGDLTLPPEFIWDEPDDVLYRFKVFVEGRELITPVLHGSSKNSGIMGH